MKEKKITLPMGAGGRLSSALIEEVFLPAYGNDALDRLEDSAVLAIEGGRLAFTTDSYTVKPLFFPGGDIGLLSVCGTVNDLAAAAALPVALSASFVIEEGFPLEDLKRIARSMGEAAARAGARIVAGDTKVVGRGEADGLFITTAGVGAVRDGWEVSAAGARPADAVIVSGTVADHGIAILDAREGLGFTPPPRSDVAPVHRFLEAIGDLGPRVRAMRDPTRGGLAGVLNEIARASRVSISIREKDVPVKPAVRACCDLLGLDPLYIANEGKLVLFVDPAAAGDVVERMRKAPGGEGAAVIGRVTGDPFRGEVPPVRLETAIGTSRFLPPMEGEPLPRIC